MKKLRLYLENHPKVPKKIILGYIIFAGCFIFPFANGRSPFDFDKAYLAIVSYGIIGLGFAGIYGINKEKFVYIASFILTGLGMVCRYFLEYGEVSNTVNFTLFNIISYLLVTPILTVISYQFIIKYLMKKN
ncbi:MAG: hypothetical protein GXY96_10655 [Tissierellia bacterium]|nr:hypothetical protein [Tissierellia bacterium]